MHSNLLWGQSYGEQIIICPNLHIFEGKHSLFDRFIHVSNSLHFHVKPTCVILGCVKHIWRPKQTDVDYWRKVGIYRVSPQH